jgi:hypothetical protein
MYKHRVLTESYKVDFNFNHKVAANLNWVYFRYGV